MTSRRRHRSDACSTPVAADHPEHGFGDRAAAGLGIDDLVAVVAKRLYGEP